MTQVSIFAGNFASQPLAFAHLLDASDAFGVVLDLDHVEVILSDPSKRLGHALSPNDCASVARAARDEALVLIFSEALIPGARLFEVTEHLRFLGRFDPIRPRVL